MTNPYRVPHYPNNADYTTNAASYYDDLARKNALMKHLAQRIWEYDKELAKRFLQWEENLATINEDVKKMLQDWLDDGTLAHIINEEIFSELNREIRELLAAFESHKQELADAEQAKKEVDLNKAKAHYLFDLNLAQRTINQGLAFDEVNNEIYASQAFRHPDEVESFYITRMTMGGKILDSMLVRFGGHGTSFGVEVTNGQVFIWSNIMRPNADNSIDTQWLVRYPYIGGGELNHASAQVEKIREYPDRNYFQSPVIDNKNGLIALRVTNDRTNLASHMELYHLNDLKNRSFNEIGRFHFTSLLNNSTLQGIAIDDKKVYLSFGYNLQEFRLVEADMETDSVTATYTAQDLRIPSTAKSFEDGMSEPEGLFLYTDPATGEKTLFQVIVSSGGNQRRNRLYAISSNEGYTKFIGHALEYAQLYPLTLNDGKGKTPDRSFTRLASLVEPGEYYLTTVDSNHYEDFPMPGVAGWWLTVSAKDAGGGVLQTLRRNSSVHSTTYKRVITGEGEATLWEGLPLRPVFENGFSDYYPDEPTQKVLYSKSDNTLFIQGFLKPPEVLNANEGRIFQLPVGFHPSVRQAVIVSTSNGMMEMMIDSDGEVWLSAYKTEARNPTYIHLNATIGLNGLAIGGV